MSADLGLEAHQAAEQHLTACWEALDAENEGEVVDWPDTAGPYCGCQTCTVREVLHAAWPYIVKYARTTTELSPN